MSVSKLAIVTAVCVIAGIVFYAARPPADIYAGSYVDPDIKVWDASDGKPEPGR